MEIKDGNTTRIIFLRSVQNAPYCTQKCILTKAKCKQNAKTAKLRDKTPQVYDDFC